MCKRRAAIQPRSCISCACLAKLGAGYRIRCSVLSASVQLLGRAIHGAMPVSGETLDELSAPMVHTDIP